MPDPVGPELVIGLVGAVGADLRRVSRALQAALSEVDYTARDVSLIEEVLRFPRWRVGGPQRLDVRYNHRMTAGDEFRKELVHKDALVLAGIAVLESMRSEYAAGPRPTQEGSGESAVALAGEPPIRPLPRTAFILRSLKTPQEVETLRNTYGDNALVVAAYVPKEDRLDALAQGIAESCQSPDKTSYVESAQHLVRRDEFEQGRPFGQNLRETFPLADYFIDATTQAAIEVSARRFVELLFGHPFQTPTREESGMFHAYGWGLRSSAPRQVGAAITTHPDGDLVAVGMNEVAKAFGGQYSSEDDEEHDHRDHRRRLDISDAMVHFILRDLLERLKKASWLGPDKHSASTDDLLRLARAQLLPAFEVDEKDLGPTSLCERAAILNLIEFLRAVHAEMAALMSAARRGVSVKGCVLYTTTFPCHECCYVPRPVA